MMKDESLDDRIARVAESVGHKKALIRKWEFSMHSKDIRVRAIEACRAPSSDRNTHLPKIAKKRKRIFFISVAASIVVICVIGLGFFLSNSDYGSAEHDHHICYAPNPDASGVTDGDKSFDYKDEAITLPHIQALIDSEDYEKALDAIESALTDTSVDSSTESILQGSIDSHDNDDAYELTWLKIKVLLKLERKSEAFDLLEAYAEKEGPHQAEALQLLQNL